MYLVIVDREASFFESIEQAQDFAYSYEHYEIYEEYANSPDNYFLIESK